MNDKISQFWQLTDLLDRTTRDIQGQPVGHVADIIVDPAEGRIAYLNVRLNNAGVEESARITVPWSAISRISEGRQDIWIAVRRDTLLRLGIRQAPGSET